MATPKRPKVRYVFKSAITGRIVKASTAKRWPDKTIRQRVGSLPRRKK